MIKYYTMQIANSTSFSSIHLKQAYLFITLQSWIILKFWEEDKGGNPLN
jgi:uncharacterized membrane protein